MEPLFPKPKCRFGARDLVVDATYVPCALSPLKVNGTEPRHRNKTDMCLQCDNTLAYEHNEIVPFSVSLKGDFSDSNNSVSYRYYRPVRI
jgi:hypothetical protein